jgi:hypothetical protein
VQPDEENEGDERANGFSVFGEVMLVLAVAKVILHWKISV